ncbi:MAG: acetylxylan esterase [Dehalococcoidia bacterium]
MNLLRRFLIRIWPLLLALALIGGMPFLLSLTHRGRVAVLAAIYLPDMVLQVDLPLRPIEFITEAPTRERITIEYESRNGPRSIEADLYMPASGDNHPGVVFSMGAPPLDLDEPRLVRIAEDTARAGVVIVVPFSERLDDEEVVAEEIDALVAEFQYVQSLPTVDPARVGFFGASVGGSLALVAAADPRIADEVDHVVSFGGYFDALQTFGAIATHHIEYGEVAEEWTPREHAEEVMAQQIIRSVEDGDDRDLLWRWFVRDDQPRPAELATLSPIGRSSYEFLSNEDPAAVPALINRLPASAVSELEYLSPRTSIERVQAELFIIHDRADPFIPYTESRRLEDAIGERGTAHFDEVRLFEHVEPKLNQRPDVIVFDSTRLLFRLYQLLLRWTA